MTLTKNNRLNLRNSFWSPDYITGIETFLEIVKNDNKCLSQELDFYRSVSLNCFVPFIDNLETICNKEYKSNDIKPLGSTCLNQFCLKMKDSGIVNIIETCTAPLSTRLSQNKLYYHELENELNEHYAAYQRTFKLVKDSYTECEILSNSIIKHLTTIHENKQSNQIDNTGDLSEATTVVNPVEDTRSNSNETLHSQDIIYPFKLDDILIFKDESELKQLLALVKSKIISQKSFISILGSPNEYFKGDALVAALKKINSKLDTSLYNLIRISQLLLSKNIIQEYHQIIGGSYFTNIKINLNIQRDDPSFELESFYIWNPSIFENATLLETNSYKKDKLNDNLYNNDIESDSSTHRDLATSMSMWFKRISGTVTDTDVNNLSLTLDELNGEIVKFKGYQNKYFEKYQRFLYARLQLEKTFFAHCKKYEKYRFKTNQLIQSVNVSFQTYINGISGILNNSPEDMTVSTLQSVKSSYPPIGFFSRDISLPYTKWIINTGNIPSYSIVETMFSCNTITKDVINSIKQIINHIESQIGHLNIDRKQILDYWSSDVDFIRATNLEREFLIGFQKINNVQSVNTDTTKLIIKHNINGSKFVLKDWIDLIKLFQLELPDSLIPMTLIDEILKDKGIEWLNLISISKLELIEMIATHLIKLGDIDSLFSLENDIPFIQYFLRIRGLSNNYEYKITKLSNIILNVFKNHLSDLSNLVISKLSEFEKSNGVTPSIQIDNNDGNLDVNKPTYKMLSPPQKNNHQNNSSHKRRKSVSMILLSSGLKNLSFEDRNQEEDEDFVPIPFKTISTRNSSPETSNEEKRKSGINLLSTPQDVQN